MRLLKSVLFICKANISFFLKMLNFLGKLAKEVEENLLSLCLFSFFPYWGLNPRLSH